MRTMLGAVCVAASLSAQVKLPAHARYVLDNGLTVTLIPKRDVPLVTVVALVRGGAEADPPDQAGLGAVTAELLRRGAGKRDSEAFASALDRLGADFDTRADNQAVRVRMEFVSKDLGPALELFSDALLRPAFSEEEVKKALAERVDAAKAAKDEPGQANRLYFRSFFFGPKHPYGRPADGDEVTLARISRAAIVSHHRSLFAARNTLLAVAGDFDPAVMLPAVKQALGAMPSGAAYAWKTAAPVRPASPRLLLVDAPEATQTYFIIAQPGIDRAHPDRTALMLVNTLFGDRFTSMLNDELRVNSGLTYGARSVVQQDRLAGALSITTFTKTETTVQAMDLALDVLRRLREKGIDAGQLKSAKAYVKGLFPVEQLETAEQVAAALGEIQLFGLNRGEVDDLFSRIDAVTPEQATEVARRHFRQENLQFCLTGAAAKIREGVSKYAPGNVRVVAAAAPGFQVVW